MLAIFPQLVSDVCGLTADEVDGMLMRQFGGLTMDLTGLDVNDRNSVRAVAHREWAGFAGSACCPACLKADGGWRVRWKLWTTFACVRHSTLLIDRCPRCQRRTGNFRAESGNGPRFSTHVPTPGRCANPLEVGASALGRAARPCGEDLAALEPVDLSGAPRLLQAQRVVDAVLTSGKAVVAGQQIPALTYFRHLRSLVALAQHAAHPGDLGGPAGADPGRPGEVLRGPG